jgi:hypothetical protein
MGGLGVGFWRSRRKKRVSEPAPREMIWVGCEEKVVRKRVRRRSRAVVRT